MVDELSLIILRGLPGSGKSTLADLLSERGKYPVYSIDDFFTDEVSGEYHFVFSQNHLAYKHCEERTAKAMLEKMDKIILHNTFTLEWEMKPYFEMAKLYGYRVFVLTVENRHGGLNCHGINREQLEKMAANYKVVLL